MSLTSITRPIEQDLEQFNQGMRDYGRSPVPLIQSVTEHIFRHGGKHLRPILLILSAKALGYQGDKHIPLAVMLEYIHTATLLHDDVVDESSMRRGQDTANTLWGNEASILVGDFLYSKAVQLLENAGSMRALKTLSSATVAIAEAEALQLSARFNKDFNETEYLHIIHGKTGQLFGIGAALGGVLMDCTAQEETALHAFGVHLGTAFQLVDDALDYCQTSETMGKNQGDDLAQGNLTLPLLYALKEGPKDKTKHILDALEARSELDFNVIVDLLETTQAINYTLLQAKNQAKLAIDTLMGCYPDNPYRQAMVELADFFIERQH